MLPMVEAANTRDSTNVLRFRNQRAANGPRMPNEAPPIAPENTKPNRKTKCQ